MYVVNLTNADIDAIQFSGNRYAWSEACERILGCEPGDVEIQESDAWELREAFEADTEGGHQYFPLLSHESDLAGKLFRLMDEIV